MAERIAAVSKCVVNLIRLEVPSVGGRDVVAVRRRVKQRSRKAIRPPFAAQQAAYRAVRYQLQAFLRLEQSVLPDRGWMAEDVGGVATTRHRLSDPRTSRGRSSVTTRGRWLVPGAVRASALHRASRSRPRRRPSQRDRSATLVGGVPFAQRRSEREGCQITLLPRANVECAECSTTLAYPSRRGGRSRVSGPQPPSAWVCAAQTH